jgi:prepilin-type N-terminal cleavage/methylation domain-containing protein
MYRIIKRSSGFTLIELLVVVAIIGILAAILFPVFARAREAARRTSCVSNVKQLGIAMASYVQDSDHRFPPPLPTPIPATPGYPCKPCRQDQGMTTFKEIVQPYIKSQQVFICPSDRGIPASVTADPFNAVAPRPKRMADFYGSSYCLNVVVTRVGNEAAIPRPAETYLGAEIWPWHAADDDAFGYWQSQAGNPVRIAYFCDGHAKVTSEKAIAQQCVPVPSMPTDTGLVAVPG